MLSSTQLWLLIDSADYTFSARDARLYLIFLI